MSDLNSWRWRAGGVPIGAGGGLARAGTSFWPDPRRQVRNVQAT